MRKILSFVETVEGVSAHAVRPDQLQIHFLSGNDDRTLVLYPSLNYCFKSIRKILSFVETVDGVSAHAVQPDQLQIHFLSGSDDLTLVLYPSLNYCFIG